MKERLICLVQSIAQSRIKHLEYLTVGPAIVFSFEKILRDELKDSLQGKNTLVLGYGNVGRAVALSLRGMQANVRVFDTDPCRMIEAKFEGFHIGSRIELLRSADVIFGTTGRQSLTQDDFQILRSGVYLVSGSSRQVEFDVVTLSGARIKKRISDSLTACLFKGKKIVLVNEGFPVNFRDNSIPMAVADLVFGGILLALKSVALKPPGFYVDPVLEGEDALLKHWLKYYQNLML